MTEENFIERERRRKREKEENEKKIREKIFSSPLCAHVCVGKEGEERGQTRERERVEETVLSSGRKFSIARKRPSLFFLFFIFFFN